jgi:MoaE-MoaD fusion protein
MRIRVLLFGQLKDIFGRQEDTLEMQPGSSLSDLIGGYAEQFPKFKRISSSIACSVNREYAPASLVLHDGDEIGLLPPVSGGLDRERITGTRKGEDHQDGRNCAGLRSAHCAIVRRNIDPQSIADALKSPEDGATAVFEGIVRNNTHGRATLYLDYEAYESMAIAEMEKLAQGALEKFSIRDVRLVHRLGRLEIGETSVAIAVASAHRDAAFEACRWLIDTLKKTIPIWKKEYFQDGAVWADGEPFPDNVGAKNELEPRSKSKEDRCPAEKNDL